MAPSVPSQPSNSIQIPTPSNLTHDTPSLPPGTHAALVTHLKESGALLSLSNLLGDSLARSGWTDRVRALTLELIRSGEAVTFPALMDEVLRRAKVAGEAEKTVTNGTHTNGGGAIVVGADWAGPDGKPNVKIPAATVEVGVEFLKEKIRDAVVVVDVDE
jgi:hypothetical protein